MKLYKLLIVHLLVYGIPAIITYILYKLTVDTAPTPGQKAGLILFLGVIYMVVWVVNASVFGADYDNYKND